MPLAPKTFDIFPNLPGVYLMKNISGTVLYVGKAKNLRNRIRQYFLKNHDKRSLIPFLMEQVEDIKTIVVTSEKESLILENNLIKKYQPKYNALLKDDKTYFSLVLNNKHKWPMLRTIRFKGNPEKDNIYFGPYPNGRAAKETLSLLRVLFPLRQCSDRELNSRIKPCILYELKQCLAPCVKKCTKDQYRDQVNGLIALLHGKDSSIVNSLKAQIEEAAESLQFEKAQLLYNNLQGLKKTLEQQYVEEEGGGDRDVIGIYRKDSAVAISQLIFQEGKLLYTNNHIFSNNIQDDDSIISSFLLQNYLDKKSTAKEIILPLVLNEQPTLSQLLNISIVSSKKEPFSNLTKIAHLNAKTYFNKKFSEREQTLLKMEELLHLTNYPDHIECIDTSSLSGSNIVSVIVSFREGQKDKSGYRKYILKEAADDYGALSEVITRRYKDSEELPDLIIVDGGKGHLNTAIKSLDSLSITTIDVLALAKEKGRHDFGLTAEKIFTKESESPITLPTRSDLLFFLQTIRDEAHRFAIKFQEQRRNKESLSSVMDSLKGIGPIKKNRLLSTFGSWQRIMQASPEEWKKVKGITKKDVETLLEQKKSFS